MSKRLAFAAVALICLGSSAAQAQGVRAFITVYNPDPQGGPGFAETLASQDWLRMTVGGQGPDFSQIDWMDNIPDPTPVEAIFVGKAISNFPEYQSYVWEVVVPSRGKGPASRIKLEVSPLNAGESFPKIKPGTKMRIEEFLWEPFYQTGGAINPSFALHVWYGTVISK